jgi:hypothetical protein
MTLGLLVGRFGSYIRENHTPPPAGVPEAPFPVHLKELRERAAHHLIPLVLLARSDREFLDSEREVIVEHCLRVARDGGIAIDGSKSTLLTAYIDSYRPTLMQLEPALHRLGRCRPAEVASLLEAAQAVIAADGLSRPEETRLLAELKEELAALATP